MPLGNSGSIAAVQNTVKALHLSMREAIVRRICKQRDIPWLRICLRLYVLLLEASQEISKLCRLGIAEIKNSVHKISRYSRLFCFFSKLGKIIPKALPAFREGVIGKEHFFFVQIVFAVSFKIHDAGGFSIEVCPYASYHCLVIQLDDAQLFQLPDVVGDGGRRDMQEIGDLLWRQRKMPCILCYSAR